MGGWGTHRLVEGIRESGEVAGVEMFCLSSFSPVSPVSSLSPLSSVSSCSPFPPYPLIAPVAPVVFMLLTSCVWRQLLKLRKSSRVQLKLLSQSKHQNQATAIFSTHSSFAEWHKQQERQSPSQKTQVPELAKQFGI